MFSTDYDIHFHPQIRDLTIQNQDLESSKQSWQSDMKLLHSKQDSRMSELTNDIKTQWRDDVTRLKNQHTSRVTQLENELSQVTRELNTTQDMLQRADQHTLRLEDELSEYQEKRDSVAQWDTQIAEIIHWYVLNEGVSGRAK